MEKKIPNISAFTFHTFKTPKGRYLEVFCGTIIETFYGQHDRLKVILRNWYNDKDCLEGLNNLIKNHEKTITYREEEGKGLDKP